MEVYKMFFVRYQERIEVTKGRHIMVVDTIMPIEKFLYAFTTEETVESLMNDPGVACADGGWQDNGVCSVTGAYLEHRIYKFICRGNLDAEKESLHKCLSDDDLRVEYAAMKADPKKC